MKSDEVTLSCRKLLEVKRSFMKLNEVIGTYMKSEESLMKDVKNMKS